MRVFSPLLGSFFVACAGDDIAIAEADLIPRIEAIIFRGRYFPEVVAVYIERAAERNLPRAAAGLPDC
jgi:hypothetical protein